MTRLAQKTALVTAAGQGIGRAIAETFAAEGARVFATDINEDTLAELDVVEGVTAFPLDVRDSSAVSDLPERIGNIDVLVNCAGFVHAGDILRCEEADWDFSFDLNVKSMYRTARTLLPGMLEQGGGSIINMASVLSSMKGVPNRFVYGASKAAVLGLTKAIAADFVTKGVRCNAICPGTVDSPSLHDRLRALGDYEQAMKDFVARQPMGRIGTAPEIAQLAVYLASDDSGFVTGQAIAIDGGWTL